MLVISDEPYRPLVFDGVTRPGDAAAHRARGAGVELVEGDGDLRASGSAIWRFLRTCRRPRRCATPARSPLGSWATSTRPAIWQWVVAAVPDATVDVSAYQEKRDLLCDFLAAAGYDVARPQGSYYVFPKTPIPDDIAFIGILQEEGILAVPGAGFGRPGYMRLSLTISARRAGALAARLPMRAPQRSRRSTPLTWCVLAVRFACKQTQLSEIRAEEVRPC